MDNFVLLKIIHGIGIVIFAVMLVLQTIILFKNKEFDIEKFKHRRLFMLIQHSSFSILILSGVTLLYLKGFQVHHWFYAKVVLFLVLMSAVIKAFKTRGVPILPVQRRAGMVLAWLAFVSILTLVLLKPVLFNG